MDSSSTPTKQRRTIRNVILGIGIVLLAALCVVGVYGFRFYQSAMRAKGHVESVVSTASALKSDDMEQALNNLGSSVDSIQSEAAAAKQEVSSKMWDVAAKLPVVGQDVTTVRSAVNVLDDFAQNTLPELKQVSDTLLKSNLSSGDGTLNLEPIISASSELTKANDSLQSQAKTINALPHATIGALQNALTKGKTQITQVADTVNSLTGLVNMLPSFLGSDGVRTYVLLAQTNSEIRSSGGLVGSAGSFTADHGKISVGDFHSDGEIHGDATDQVGDGEYTLWSGLEYGSVIHNISASPDFPQVARMASEFWKQYAGVDSDGVMSLDPVALQAMIQVTGSVTMPDGRVLDGTNTADFLLNGVYKEVAESAQDQYFEATASQVIAHMFSDMSSSKLISLAKAMINMASQRHVYFWSFHDEDTQVLRSAGVTHEITSDASKPQMGMYLNEMQASKIDYYCDRKTVVKRTGDQSYHVTVTFTNTLDAATAATLPRYITANAADGAIYNDVALFTPTGGTLSNLTSSTGSQFTEIQAYSRSVMKTSIKVPVGQTVTLEWDVTCADGAADLVFDQTPTNSDDPGITYEY